MAEDVNEYEQMLGLFKAEGKHRLKCYKKCKNRNSMHLLANKIRHNSCNIVLAGYIYTYDEFNKLIKDDREYLKKVASYNNKTDLDFIKSNQECAANYMFNHLPMAQKEAGIICKEGSDCHCIYAIVEKYRAKKGLK